MGSEPRVSDSKEFEDFLLNHQDMVYATAYRIVSHESEARDIAQESFIRAWRHWSELSGNPSASGWIRTVARNLALNHIQRHRARWSLFSDLKSPHSDDDAPGLDSTFSIPDSQSQELLTREQREILESGIARLPKDQRVALVLFHFEDLDYNEIAQQLGISLGKVKTDIHRARLALWKSLQPRRDELGI